MPGIAGGTTRLMVLKVNAATASDEGLGPGYSDPCKQKAGKHDPTVFGAGFF